jgi:hypothetical protein
VIYTSSFQQSGKHPNAVAISRGVPVWFKNRRIYDPLRPSRAMLELKGPAFDAAYGALLAALTPRLVAKELGDGAILLCWENEPADCHRGAVADWLRAAGYEVEEIA